MPRAPAPFPFDPSNERSSRASSLRSSLSVRFKEVISVRQSFVREPVSSQDSDGKPTRWGTISGLLSSLRNSWSLTIPRLVPSFLCSLNSLDSIKEKTALKKWKRRAEGSRLWPIFRPLNLERAISNGIEKIFLAKKMNRDCFLK